MDTKKVSSKSTGRVMSALVGDEKATYLDFFIFVLIQRNLEIIETYKDLSDSMKEKELNPEAPNRTVIFEEICCKKPDFHLFYCQ